MADFYNENLLVETRFLKENIEERVYGKYNLCLQKHISGNYCVGISNDNKYAASGSHDTFIRVWNIENRMQEYFLKGHNGIIFCIAFTPDDKYIVSGSSDKTVRVWDTHQKVQHAVLLGHFNCVTGIVITHDSNYVISTSKDEILLVWKL